MYISNNPKRFGSLTAWIKHIVIMYEYLSIFISNIIKFFIFFLQLVLTVKVKLWDSQVDPQIMAELKSVCLENGAVSVTTNGTGMMPESSVKWAVLIHHVSRKYRLFLVKVIVMTFLLLLYYRCFILHWV